MITFGIEGIRYFDEVNKTGNIVKGKAIELGYTFNVCNGLHHKLLKAGHNDKFYHGDKECWAIHLNDASLKAGGIDDKWADDVDLFFIATHGNNDKDNNKPLLLYNVEKDAWWGNGIDWKLGNKGLKWLLLRSCSGINLKNVMACIDIFDKLHGICAAYGRMWDGITTDEAGEDLAEYLIDGDTTVADAWFKAQSDWRYDNHPIVICANGQVSYDVKGNLIKFLSTLNLDYLTPRGFTMPEVPRSKIVGLHWMWVE